MNGNVWTSLAFAFLLPFRLRGRVVFVRVGVVCKLGVIFLLFFRLCKKTKHEKKLHTVVCLYFVHKSFV